jgi:hypothetical protein
MERIVCPKCHSAKVAPILNDDNALRPLIFTGDVIRIVCLNCGNIFNPDSSIIKTTDSNGNVVYQAKSVKYKPLTIILVCAVILICIGLIVYLMLK